MFITWRVEIRHAVPVEKSPVLNVCLFSNSAQIIKSPPMVQFSKLWEFLKIQAFFFLFKDLNWLHHVRRTYEYIQIALLYLRQAVQGQGMHWMHQGPMKCPPLIERLRSIYTWFAFQFDTWRSKLTLYFMRLHKARLARYVWKICEISTCIEHALCLKVNILDVYRSNEVCIYAFNVNVIRPSVVYPILNSTPTYSLHQGWNLIGLLKVIRRSSLILDIS